MPVDLDVRDRVALVTLNRPEALNALDQRMRTELEDAWQTVVQRDDIWVTILTGAGDRAFCVGSDLKERPTDDSPFASQAFAGGGEPHLLRRMQFDKPLICAINGHALGGGLELALGCDIRIASADASMGLPEVVVGSMPGAGGTQNLPRAIGASNAMYLLLTGERISSERAHTMGLVSEVVRGSDLMARAHEIADMIARNAPLSVRATKRLAKCALDLPSPRGMEAERHAWGLLKSTDDRAEGRNAFREKRPPHYRGR